MKSLTGLFLLSRLAHVGCDMGTWVERAEDQYFIGCSKWFLNYAGLAIYRGSWQSAILRNLHGEESRLLREALRYTQPFLTSGAITSCTILNHTIQKNGCCNLVLIICIVGTGTAYLMGMLQRILNWNNHKAPSQVYKVLWRTNTEVNTEIHILFPGNWLFWRLRKNDVSEGFWQ